MSLQVSNFESLVGAIADVHQRLQSDARTGSSPDEQYRETTIVQLFGVLPCLSPDRADTVHTIVRPLSLIPCNEMCRFLEAQMAEEFAAEAAENLES